MSRYRIQQKARFHIQVQGSISEVWKEWFTNVQYSCKGDLIYLETDPLDQSGLLGLLSNLSSLGYFILSVQVHSMQRNGKNT